MPEFHADGIEVYVEAYRSTCLDHLEDVDRITVHQHKNSEEAKKINKTLDELNVFINELFLNDFQTIMNESTIPAAVLEHLIKEQLITRVITPFLKNKLVKTTTS